MKKESFEKRLKSLNEIGNRLLLSRSLVELCRMAVTLGRKRLGFDRISTWFVDKDSRYIVGSYGVDEKGRLRRETKDRVLIKDDPLMAELARTGKRSIVRRGAVLRNHKGEAVGKGLHLITLIWDGRRTVGYLSTDNLLSKNLFDHYDIDLFELYASTFGHLYTLKKAEDELKQAYAVLKRTQAQLIQAAKMEVVGSLASGAAHEVKNPLAIILQGVEYISRKTDPADEITSSAIRSIKDAVRKADSIIKGLLDFSMITEPQLLEQNINSVVERSLRLVGFEIDKRRVVLSKELGKRIPQVRIDENKIEQVLVNLYLNALRAIGTAGVLTIRTYSKAASDKKTKVYVEVIDNGTGIPDREIHKIFDPFYTTHRHEGGTGLGLTIARNIMNMHGGEIIVENIMKNGRGCRATLVFNV